MASTESKIRLIFDGVDRVSAAAAKVKAAVKSLNDESSKASQAFDAFSKSMDKVDVGVSKVGTGLLGIAKGITVLGSAAAAGNVIAGTVGALAQLAPIALVLPGALLAAGAAVGTLAVAMGGFSDAIAAGLHGDLAFFNEALSVMPGAMQEAARAVVAFKPQLEDLKLHVQQNFWTQFSDDITKLGNNLLPTLKSGMVGIAGELGKMVKGAVDVASTPFFRGQVASILVSTRALIENMRPALGNVLAGFVSLGEVGATFMPRLGTAITNVTEKFKNWATSVEGQEQIKRFIENAIQGFKDLAGIVKNVGSIFGAVFQGLGASMESPLKFLKDLTGQLAEFLKTAEAQEGLRALGEIIQTAGKALGEVFMAAMKQVLPIIKEWAPAIKEIILGFKDFALELIAVVGPALRDLGKFLSENKDTLRDLVPFIAGAVLAFKGLKILTSIVGWAKDATKAIKSITDILPDLDKKVGAAGKALKGLTLIKAGLWAAAFLAAIEVVKGGIEGYTDAQQKAFDQGNFLEDLQVFAKEFDINPFKAIGKEIVASLTPPPETVDFARKWAAVVDPIGTAIRESFDRSAQAARESMLKIGDGVAGLGDVIVGHATQATARFNTAVVAGFEQSRAIVAAVPGNIVTALSPLGGLLGNSATTSTGQFSSAAQAGFNAAIGIIRGVPNSIVSALSPLAGLLGSTATSSTDRFRSGAQAGFNAAVGATRAVPGQVNGALAPLAGQLGTTGANAGNTFNQRLTGALNAAAAAARGATAGIAGSIQGALSGLGGIGASAGAALGRGLVSGLNSMGGAVAAAAGRIAATAAAAVRAAAAIRSPSKVFAELGTQMGAGLVVGLTGGQASVAAAASRLVTSALGGGLGAGLSISAPSPAAGAMQSLASSLTSRGSEPLQVRVFIGDRELTDLVRTEVDTSNRAVRRTVGAGGGTTF